MDVRLGKKRKMKKKKIKFPNRKISETFLDFSSPLLNSLEKDVTKSQVEKVLVIAYTVWNSVVLDTVKGNTKHISMLKQTIREDPISAILIEEMISRKKNMFADDLRMIGNYSIFQNNGEWRLRAEARDPSSLP